jgi:hypothetical protein
MLLLCIYNHLVVRLVLKCILRPSSSAASASKRKADAAAAAAAAAAASAAAAADGPKKKQQKTSSSGSTANSSRKSNEDPEVVFRAHDVLIIFILNQYDVRSSGCKVLKRRQKYALTFFLYGFIAVGILTVVP